MLTPIAIKVLSPNSRGKRKLEPFQIYYLLEGFEIKDNGHMYIQSYRLEKTLCTKIISKNKKYPISVYLP